MIDLGLDISKIKHWFQDKNQGTYILVPMTEEHAATWSGELCESVRKCYVTDKNLAVQAGRTGMTREALLAAKLPEKGAIMAGDFGEIMVFLYHAAYEHPKVLVGPKKWQLKEDRRRPAPYSDVVHFRVPSWPDASEKDSILCSEVKTKSTPSNSSPIQDAIDDCAKDRKDRLLKTLLWLKERAMYEDLGSTTLGHLERFIKATDHPPSQKHFRAVAVVCSSLLNQALSDAPKEIPDDFTVVVISVPSLKQKYEKMYEAVIATVEEREIIK